MNESLWSRICAYAGQNEGACAILAPNRPELTYGRLKLCVEQTAEALHSFGFGRGDRVATAFPFGPDGAVLHVALASCATALPLDPRAPGPEAEYLLEAGRCAALVVPAGMQSDIAAIARARGIAILELGGDFILRGSEAAGPARGEWACLDDDAVILCTSGTTSRPKLVPLTHRNLAASLAYFEQALGMSPLDRCLNLMPMFHSLGLLSGVFVPLFSGGSTVCLPGTIASRFFDRVAEFSATWYSAVPAVHASIVDAAPPNSAQMCRSLRFARTSSAPMSGDLQEKLERTLGAPLVQVYGATEAPLSLFQAAPPFARKPGSVGVAAGCGVGILSDKGEFLPPGRIGEVVLSGPHVMAGYLNDPAACAQAFHGRWFRTGDLGLLDEDGYLFLQGRIRELINRGGEKIAPGEIDEVLARHPAVAEAAAYPVPDERLGEEIAALVVLRPGAEATVQQLRRFCAARLSAHKLPRWIQLAPRIPRTAAGKVNRKSLAEHFPPAVGEGCPQGSLCACEGESVIENFLLPLWKKHLKAQVGRHTDFFEAGGDSLAGAELLVSIETALGANELGPAALLEAPSVEKMAVLLSAGSDRRPSLASSVAPFRVASDRPPVYLVAPGYELRLLQNQMPPGQPLAVLSVPEPPLIGSPYSVQKIGEECVRRLRKKQPSGPYFLGGWCFAGIVAYEMAMQLMSCGESVPLLILFDLPDIAPGSRPSVWPRLRFHACRLRSQPPREWPPYLFDRLRTLGGRCRRVISRTPSRMMRRLGQEPPHWLWNTALAQGQATREYRPAPYPGRAIHVVPRLRSIQDKPLHWTALASGAWETFEAPGTHLTMFESDALGARLRSCLQSFDPPQKVLAAAR